MIRVATIGTSTITERFAAGVAGVDGITISHAYSRDPAKAAATAAAFGAEPASDLTALLASGCAEVTLMPYLVPKAVIASP